MIKFFQTREEAIEYALKIAREREAEAAFVDILIDEYIKQSIASGLIGDN